MSSFHHRLRRAAAGAVIAGTVVAASASPVHATKVEHVRYEGTDSGVFEDCGMQLAFEDEFSGTFKIREDRPGSTAFLVSDNYAYRSVITNTANGKWLVIRGHGVFRDMTATHVDGDVYRFRSHLAGQPFVMENSDGQVVLRDSGVIVFDGVFDTFGDDVPGGEFLSVDVAAIHGPHPGFEALETNEGDICPTAQALLG